MTKALQPHRREQRTPEFRAKYRERVKVEYRIGRMVQLGVRQAHYFGKKKLAFQIALVATVASLTLTAAHSGLDAFFLYRSAPMLLFAAGQAIAPTANLRDTIESQWAAFCVPAPSAPKIAICRPLF